MTARHSRGPRLFLSDVRFFVSGQPVLQLEIPEKESHYLRDVLRLQIGDTVEIGDSSGGVIAYTTIIELSERVLVSLRSLSQIEKSNIPTVHILCALCKGDKNDRICDWATELGCWSITFWQSSRSIVRLRDEQECQRKTERLASIAVAAAQQSKQAHPPKVGVYRSLEMALQAAMIGSYEKKFICSLEPSAPLFQTSLLSDSNSPIVLAVGPEGDFSPEEYFALTTTHGFTPISLGNSVLRSELAVVTAITMVKGSLRGT